MNWHTHAAAARDVGLPFTSRGYCEPTVGGPSARIERTFCVVS